MQALATRNDPIFEVTGVPAAEILERCAQTRTLSTGGAVCNSGTPADVAKKPRKAWRLSQFSQGTNLEFVQLAYLALLNRPATSKEIAKRLRQLSSGKTRLGVMARLMLLPESCEQDLKLRGFVLRAVRKYARFSYKRFNKDHSSERVKPVELSTPVLNDSLVHEILSALRAIPKIGRMQREIKQLKREVRQLRARIEQ